MSMNKYTFKWPLTGANEVYVTGTFDSWSKSIKLVENKNGTFAKSVELPMSVLDSEKIIYKFVVDGNWTIDPNSRKEVDLQSGIENNVLLIEDLSCNLEDSSYSYTNISSPNFKSEDGSSEFTSISYPSQEQEVYVDSIISREEEDGVYVSGDIEDTEVINTDEIPINIEMSDSIQITLKGNDNQSLVSNTSNNSAGANNINVLITNSNHSNGGSNNNNSINGTASNSPIAQNRSSNDLRNPNFLYRLRSFLKN